MKIKGMAVKKKKAKAYSMSITLKYIFIIMCSIFLEVSSGYGDKGKEESVAAKIPVTGKVMVSYEFQMQDSTLLYNWNIPG